MQRSIFGMRWVGALRAAIVSLCLASGVAWAQDKVVYHFDNASDQATRGLRSIRNHLDVAPETKVVVVALGDGIDFLLDGAKDKRNANIDYNALVTDLRGRGVRFEVCEITLTGRGLKRDQFTLDAEFTRSGVVRITQLQARDRYAYVKP